MPYDHDVLAEMDEQIDALESPTVEEVYDTALPYEAGMVAASAVRRSLAGGGGGGGGGSSSVKIVDLGVVDLATVFTEGPQTLYTPTSGEFLSTIRYQDLDFEAIDDNGFLGNANGVAFGTIKSFGWLGFAYGSEQDIYIDTLGLVTGGSAYGPALETISGFAQVLSAAAGGAVKVGYWESDNHGNGLLYAAIVAWVAAAAYKSVFGFTDPPTTLRVAVVANGTVWRNVGGAGTSGASTPDFAGNVGSTVGDNNTSHAITAVDQGSNTVTVAGDQTAIAAAGSKFQIAGSTGNDGVYTVATAVFADGSTTIGTQETVADGTEDGDVLLGILWQDTTTVPITQGSVHPVAEIWTPS